MDIRYFLGANTAAGFYSHYDQLLPEASRRMVRILKGGPGCGKSTLMKKVAAHGTQLGFPVHRIPCSSDPDSLDGVVIPEAGYAVVDGTAPHVVEPQLYGATESYLNLAVGYDSEGLHQNRRVILEIRQAGLDCYPQATACLKAVADLEALRESGHPLPESVIDKEIPDQGGTGTVRTIFLSGHTPKGRMTCWETAEVLCSRIYALRGTMADVTDFLRKAVSAAVSRGWDCLLCDSSLLPGRYLEHLLIPELGIAFLSDHHLDPCPCRPYGVLGSHSPDTALDAMQQSLLQRASAHLRQAKAYHDLLEKAYAPFTGFAAANQAALDCCAELETLR